VAVVVSAVWPTHIAAQAADPPLAGDWSGAISVAGIVIPMRVSFREAAIGLAATIDIQGATGQPLTKVSRTGVQVHFELASPLGQAIFEGAVAGSTIDGRFTQGAGVGTFHLERIPDAPAASSASDQFRSSDVSFMNGGLTLAGTLLVPNGSGPFPAVVLLTGSGQENRDEEVFGFRPFKLIAEYLAAHGIAALRYDDRGVGGSSPGPSTASDTAEDARAAITFLSGRPDISRGQIGLIGHSEGAESAAIAASKSPAVAFIVMLAGPAVRGDAILHRQAVDLAKLGGATPAQVDAVAVAHAKVMADALAGASDAELSADVRALILAQIAGQPAARTSVGDPNAYADRALPTVLAQIKSPTMRALIAFDPAPVLAQVGCPIFAIFGAKDLQVAPDLNRPALEAAIRYGTKKPPLKVMIYPDANHLFQKAVTGSPNEYAALDKTFVPGLLDDMAQWITQSVRGR
jgi:pimeloyl-ACP methyl ester carboxylesterase